MNAAKTTLLMTGLIVLLSLFGRAVGGPRGMMLFFMLALGINFFSYWFSGSMVLKMYGARRLERSEAPELFDLVEAEARKAGLPMPGVAILPTMQPNAFATGRNPENAVVAVTEGIMKILDRNELSGVIGHELGHVKHRDLLIGMVASTMAGSISMLASVVKWGYIFGYNRSSDRGGGFGALIMAILAPIVAMIIQLAISRSREYAADRAGAEISGDPRYLAGALRKLEAGAQAVPMREAGMATSHLFIVNPLRGSAVAGLFRTHPPTEERIKRLEQMALERL